MPKETIHHGTPHADDFTEFGLSVNWHSQHGQVQVGISARNGYWRSIVPEGPEADDYAVWTVPLERHEINRMIRALRRARDAAFGADE